MDERLKQLIAQYVDKNPYQGYDVNNSDLSNFGNYLKSPEYSAEVKKGAEAMTEAAIEGNLGVGSGLKSITFNPEVRNVASALMKKLGVDLSHSPGNAAIDVNKAKEIANAYELMQHNPDNPEVKAAYDALKKETMDQYKAIKESGLNVSPIESGMENPYKTSTDLHQDILKNKHLSYYPTDQGFGQSTVTNHPLLEPTTEMVNGKPLLSNDIFRIVHDYMGHAKEGTSFGPKGEEAAWLNHMKMYSPEAQKALTTETRGQNSWVNYGPMGEANRANPKNTIYADQKAGILPDYAMEPNHQPIDIDPNDLIKLQTLKSIRDN